MGIVPVPNSLGGLYRISTKTTVYDRSNGLAAARVRTARKTLMLVPDGSTFRGSVGNPPTRCDVDPMSLL